MASEAKPTPPSLPSQPLDALKHIKAYLFDCDGVIWVGNTLIPGVLELIDALRAAEKKFYFVTNNATKSRDMYVERFAGYGIILHKSQIISSGWATAKWLSKNFKEYKKGVYVVGEAGLCAELDGEQVPWIGGPHHSQLTPAEVDHFNPAEHDVGAVVVGLDRHISYAKLAIAQQFLLRGSATSDAASLQFIVSNPDVSYPHKEGIVYPGVGAIVAAISACTHRSPSVVVGKPNPFMLELLEDAAHLDPAEILMVGDRLDTDIAFGARHGTTTLLVFSGVAKESDLPHAEYPPSFTAESVQQLIPFLKAQAVSS